MHLLKLCIFFLFVQFDLYAAIEGPNSEPVQDNIHIIKGLIEQAQTELKLLESSGQLGNNIQALKLLIQALSQEFILRS